MGPPVRLRSLQGSLRRSLSVFRNSRSIPESEPTPGSLSRKSSFHEIVVHGYGNGTNDVRINEGALEVQDGGVLVKNAQLDDGGALANRSHSTASTASTSSTSSDSSSAAQSVASSTSTAPSVHSVSSGAAKAARLPEKEAERLPFRGRLPFRPEIPERHASIKGAQSVASSVYSIHTATDDEADGREKDPAPPAVPRRSSLRQQRTAMAPGPLRIRKGRASLPEDPDPWVPVQWETGSAAHEGGEVDAEKQVKLADAQQYVQDVQNIMDQFMGVGGLQEPIAGNKAKVRWSIY